MSSYEFVMIDDVTDKTLTGKDCFKGDSKKGKNSNGIMTKPLMGIVAAATVLASLY
jgi:hypothetical protein